MKRRFAFVFIGLAACAVAGSIPTLAQTAKSASPAIGEDAGNVLLQMGKTLQGKEFSFKAQTIRYSRMPTLSRSTSFTP